MARPRVHDSALRARLLDVATELLAGAGPDALTVRSAAARASTSTTAVYSLFGSRDGLVEAASEHAAERFATHLRAAPTAEDPGPQLLELGLAYRRFALEQPHAYRLMFSAPVAGRSQVPAGPVDDAPSFRVLREAVCAVLATGGHAPDETAVVRAAASIWALAHGLVSLELTDQLPVPAAERSASYRAALQAAGPALLAAASGGLPPTAG